MDPRYEHFKNFSSADLSFAEKRKVWLEISDMSGDEFDAMMAEQKARRKSATGHLILSWKCSTGRKNAPARPSASPA